MRLLVVVWMLAGFVLALWILHRQNRLSRPAIIGCAGLGIAFLGGALTPGIGWGDFDTDSVLEPIGALVFYVGVGVMVWAALAWRRARSRRRAEPTS